MVMIVLSKKMRNRSAKFTGNFEPKITAPVSDIYKSCVTETAATINLVIGDWMLAAKIDGTTISAKPTTIVELAAAASGTLNKLKIGSKGFPSQVNMGVASDNTKANVPAAIIIGTTPNHKSKTVFVPFFKN